MPGVEAHLPWTASIVRREVPYPQAVIGGRRTQRLGVSFAALLSAFGASTCARDAQDIAVSEPSWFRRVDAGVELTRTNAQYTGLHARMAGGVCVFDVDADGVLDVLFAEPASAGGVRMVRGTARSLLGFGFEDVTAKQGLTGVDGEGCTVFDVEGDGDPDVVVTAVGKIRLFRNDGGTLVDDSARLGAFDAALHTTAAVAFDADDDGDLDLAIGSYGRFVPPIGGADCIVTPCEVNNAYYQDGRALLFLQQPDGGFVDRSELLGDAPTGKVLVLLATDLDEDGHLDLFVGHDDPTTKDLYLVKSAAGAWVDHAAQLGVAVNARSNGISSMSATDVDLDGDGHLDLVESSWEDDADSVFRCAAGTCVEIGDALELFRGPKDLRWGQAIADFDDDGLLEIFEGVGQVYRSEDLTKPDSGRTFGAVSGPSILWHRSTLNSPFALAPTDDGLSSILGARGAIAADFDRDGALDLVVAPALGDALFLHGVHAPRGHHLEIVLKGQGKNSRAIGARVVVHAAGRSYPALVHAGQGYLSAIDAPLHFGLGNATSVDLDVAWPSGKRTHEGSVSVDRVIVVTEP